MRVIQRILLTLLSSISIIIYKNFIFIYSDKFYVNELEYLFINNFCFLENKFLIFSLFYERAI